MFKPVKWRSERNIVKALFKLQFHLTQVPKSAEDGLVIYMIPVELGRTTGKVEKGILRDGSYYWDYAVYETVKFVHDSRTSTVSPRIYQFRITNGSSKADPVGEAYLNISDYFNATKSSSVSLPLKNSNHNLILHVLIQRLEENVINRNAERSEETIKSPRTTLKAQLSFEDTDEYLTTISIENDSFGKRTSQNLENGDDKACSESNLTLSGSESSSGDNTPHPNNQEERESNNLPSSRSQPDWSSESSESSNHSIEKLKSDLDVLSRQAELSELEVHSLRKQIVKESKRAQELSKEVAILKEERELHRAEFEEFKAIYNHSDGKKHRNHPRFDSGNSETMIEELRQEFHCEKELNSNLRVQIQKMQESNAELILAVQDLESMLEQKNKVILDFQDRKAEGSEELDDEQKALEELVKEHRDAEKGYLLEQKMLDLVSEIEICKREKDEVEIQIEQLALDYEILKQENHDLSCKLGQNTKVPYTLSSSVELIELESQVENLEKELKQESEKSSESMAVIAELKIKVKNLEDDLEKQTMDFESDLNILTSEKVKQEKRAIQAEEALRSTRRRNAKIAERLQEELKEFSLQMASAFDESERTAIKASAEAGELRAQRNRLEDLLREEREKLQYLTESYDGRLQKLADEVNCKKLHMEEMILKIEDSYKILEEETNVFYEEFEFMKAENERLRSEADKCVDELNEIRVLKDEREAMVGNLKMEIEEMRGQCGDLRASLFEGEIEKEKLRKQVYQLKDEVKKKEDAIAIAEKKLKSCNGMIDGSKETLKSKKSVSTTQGSKVASNLRERIKFLEEQIQQKETALECSTNAFLEKETNFLHKIDELQSTIDEFNQRNPNVSQLEYHQVDGSTKTAFCSNETRIESPVQRNEDDKEKRLNGANMDDIDETASLRDRNQIMEHELKEMHQRYSEISLKFAEVEGERQMLVMTLRNLKNATNIF